jgi:shikimate dehydrogenase
VIDARTEVYAVIGRPLDHTLSPAVHNAAFAAVGRNAVYLALPTADPAGALAGARALGLRGLSITIPHKEAALAGVDEVEAEARALGAINTVIIRDGLLKGTNTDAPAIVACLERVGPVAGRRALILGTGGAARAAAFGLSKAGAEVIVAGRRAERAAELARDLGVGGESWSEIGSIDPGLVINATPVGMWPRAGETPLEVAILNPGTVVLDMVYNPLHTRLLTQARERGLITVSGLEVFLDQAARQFELWTDTPAPVRVMREAALTELGGG